MARRANAADQLNRTLLFGESERPDDLTTDWCYVSAKNAHKRVEHATRLAQEREGEGEREREKDLIKEGGREGGETRSHQDFQIEDKERIFEMDYTHGVGVKLGQEK